MSNDREKRPNARAVRSLGVSDKPVEVQRAPSVQAEIDAARAKRETAEREAAERKAFQEQEEKQRREIETERSARLAQSTTTAAHRRAWGMTFADIVRAADMLRSTGRATGSMAQVISEATGGIGPAPGLMSSSVPNRFGIQRGDLQGDLTGAMRALIQAMRPEQRGSWAGVGVRWTMPGAQNGLGMRYSVAFDCSPRGLDGSLQRPDVATREVDYLALQDGNTEVAVELAVSFRDEYRQMRALVHDVNVIHFDGEAFVENNVRNMMYEVAMRLPYTHVVVSGTGTPGAILRAAVMREQESRRDALLAHVLSTNVRAELSDIRHMAHMGNSYFILRAWTVPDHGTIYAYQDDGEEFRMITQRSYSAESNSYACAMGEVITALFARNA